MLAAAVPDGLLSCRVVLCRVVSCKVSVESFFTRIVAPWRCWTCHPSLECSSAMHTALLTRNLPSVSQAKHARGVDFK